MTITRRRAIVRYPDLRTYFAKTHDTQARVAAAVGATQGQISRILHGQILPRPPLARRLAAHCSIPFDSFFLTYSRGESHD